MSRLSRYLVGQFARDSLALFIVTTLLLWLTQMLRLFDLVTVKGQGLITLAGQAFLTTPPLVREITYICMAIGLTRAFKSLQNSHELHIIHSAHRLGAIWSALVAFSVTGALLVLAVAHWAEPISRRATSEWVAQIAAELVGENLVPGRFIEIADDVVLQIGGRRGDGVITNFFVNDSRETTGRRTYVAQTAIIVTTDEGYQISLRNGRLGSTTPEGLYSEVEFARYELALDKLTEEKEIADTPRSMNSWDLVYQAVQNNDWSDEIVSQLHKRNAEGLRIVAICLLVASVMAFPNARRKSSWVPPELLALIIAFGERIVSNSMSIGVGLGYYVGPAVMLIAAVGILSARLARSRQHESQPVVA